MPDYAEWVSTLALVLSAGSLGWQVVKARREQPIITVDGRGVAARHRESGGWTEPYWRLPINVTNAGGQAVTIVDVYWQVMGTAGAFAVKSSDGGIALPARLEPLSAEAWEVQAPIGGWSGLTAHPAADVVLRRGVVTVYGPPTVLWAPEKTEWGSASDG